MDLNKTLEQLENDYWTEPTYDSHLVKTCHALRKKPLKDFKIEDFRILIGQNFSLDILIPLAKIEIEKNLLAEGDLYPGDLLLVLLRVESKYWINHKQEWAKINGLVNDKIDLINSNANMQIMKAFEIFKKINTC